MVNPSLNLATYNNWRPLGYSPLVSGFFIAGKLVLQALFASFYHTRDTSLVQETCLTIAGGGQANIKIKIWDFKEHKVTTICVMTSCITANCRLPHIQRPNLGTQILTLRTDCCLTDLTTTVCDMHSGLSPEKLLKSKQLTLRPEVMHPKMQLVGSVFEVSMTNRWSP